MIEVIVANPAMIEAYRAGALLIDTVKRNLRAALQNCALAELVPTTFHYNLLFGARGLGVIPFEQQWSD